jgi:hypothetical protein
LSVCARFAWIPRISGFHTLDTLRKQKNDRLCILVLSDIAHEL